MKKKTKLPRKKAASARPPKVGGTVRGEAKVNWSKVGRRRHEDNDTMSELSAALKAARESQGVKLSALAKDLNVAPATMIKFEERNHPVSVALVLEMAEKLGYQLELRKKSGKGK